MITVLTLLMPWLFVANLVPALILYFWFKQTEKNLLDDWQALFKDGLASGTAALWVGVSLIYFFDSWPEIIGWFLVVWSLTYWASAGLAWQRLQAIRAGKPVAVPFPDRNPISVAPSALPNRQQRRKQRRRGS